ncbi:MAG: hypothetical protein Q4P66_04845 [Actinomycetaceae bacterium]|nr:hypothetical protein [Actinomycetaceae bacterium]MDO5746971.1 hypothetical protein [Actinomycetaceae bacterium]
MSADSLSRILEDMLGMHQLDSREIDSQLRKLSCDIPTPWVWHPWRPENVDDFLENIDKRFSLE